MRWFTGTPRNFEGGQTFFDRDSGLTMRGFAALGVESGAITLGPARADDLPEMTRATRAELEDPAWWAARHLDGLVFYTWGQPQYIGMVRAARAAGIKVAQVTDTQGIMSPVADWKSHMLSEAAHFWHEPRWKQWCRTLAKAPYTHTLRLIHRDLPMARAIAASDVFLAATPTAAVRFKKFMGMLQGREASDRVWMVPIPVNFHFCYGATDQKQDEVIAVGRWDSQQKRTPLLLETISLALQRNPGITFTIYGQASPEMATWHRHLTARQRANVRLEGVVSNVTLAAAYRRAKVMLVSAAYEGCHNASAEAICSGASVVGCRSPFLGAIDWHASKNSGRLAVRATPEALAAALHDELVAWDHGQRDPVAISAAWTRELHPDRVAARILDLCQVPHIPPTR